MSTIDNDSNTNEDNAAASLPDELTSLKERADFLGVTYHPSIGLEKLREKVNAVMNGTAPAPGDLPKEETPAPVVVAAPAPAPVAAPSPAAPVVQQTIPANATPVVFAAPAASETAAVVSAAPALIENEGQKRFRLKRESLKLVRVRITCMNPAKKEWEGEIFTVGNSNIGTIKKFVPFDVDEGWHIPQIMLTMIKERQCQVFTTSKTKNGPSAVGAIAVRQGKLIREFAIEILDPLTPEELQDLAQRQAMSGSIDPS